MNMYYLKAGIAKFRISEGHARPVSGTQGSELISPVPQLPEQTGPDLSLYSPPTPAPL